MRIYAAECTHDDVVHHDVHAHELTPKLARDTRNRARPQALPEHVAVGDLGCLLLETHRLAQLSDLVRHERRIQGLIVNPRDHILRLVPPPVGGEPAAGFWKKEHADREQEPGDHLQTPCETEGGWAWDEGAAVGKVEHDEDADGDRELLTRHEATTDSLW